jgi:hypothetical protein
MSAGGVVVLWLFGLVTIAIRAFSGPAKGDLAYGDQEAACVSHRIRIRLSLCCGVLGRSKVRIAKSHDGARRAL